MRVPLAALVRVFAVLFFLALSPRAVHAADAKPLTNADIVTLAKAGFGAEVLTAKIEAAITVDFDLSSDALVKLKQQGVPQPVIAAMLKRESSPRTASVPASAAAAAQSGKAASSAPWQVRLVASSGTVDLIKSAGAVDSAAFGTKTFHTFSGATAQTRTRDRQPALLIATTSNPNGQYFLVKTDSSTKRRLRSVKIGAGMLGLRNSTTPDEDWTIPYDAIQQEPGIWRLHLSQPLEPGEYGVYLANQNQLAAGDLYDFGVDL
jgi:hypothetical protein